MSYLSRPVFHFKGGVYANPSTANNQDFADVFSVDTLTFNATMTPIGGATVQYPAGQQTLPYSGPADAAQARAWLMGLMKGVNSKEGGPYGQQAHWNYYGDHATRFESATVNTIWARPGVTVPDTDPLYGATVQIIGNEFGGQTLNAVMVDVDPLALITTQIFSAGFQVTAADGTTLIDAQQNNRAFSYFINPNKNVDPHAIGFQMVSAVFIGSVQNGPGLKINPWKVISPALDDLAAAVAAGAGLNIRYCFYDAIYNTTPKDLHDNYAKGNYSPNPYVGKVLGTIGVLQPDEMLSAPAARKLYVQTMFSTSETTCGGQAVTPPATIALGEALANVDTANSLVTLDAISTFPECDVKTNEKLSLGTVNLVVVPASGGTPITIGPIPNDRQTYESGGGLVEISYASSPNLTEIQQNIAAGTLAIQGLSPVKTLLAEVPDIDIQTDDRAVYFQEAIPQAGGPPVPGTATITIKVFRKGVLAQTPTTVILEHWMCQKDYINPDKPMVPVPLPGVSPAPSGPYFSVAGATALPDTTYTLGYYGGGARTVPVLTEQVVVPAGGVLTLTLTAIRPGTCAIRFRDANVHGVAPNFAWDNEFYAVVRILPTDDYSSYTDEQINNWPFIYREVFCYFSLLYPIMSTFIPWGPADAPQDPEKVKAFANNIIQFTDPNFWQSTLYMPITRELSAGKRELLVRWCNLNT